MRGRARRGPKRAGAGTLRLRSISLQNFKSFRDETEIPLGQITYLIGPNGAGKSNALHGLKTIAAAITSDVYAPKQGDYFDNDTGRAMKLAAVMELSGSERQAMISRVKTRPASHSRGGLGGWLFRRLKYETSFSGPSRTQAISLTFTNASYHTFASIEHGNGDHTAMQRTIETIDAREKHLPEPEPYGVHSLAPSALFKQVDKSLASPVHDLFSGIVHTTTRRSIPDSTPAHQSSGVTPDGDDIFNELNDLHREKQLEFDRFVSAITDGSITGVEPKMRGSELVLEITEPGLGRRTLHTDLGSGQKQLVLLALQLFTRPGTVFILTEPELHLHSRAQRQIRAGLMNASTKLQIAVETHSPIFLGTGRGESTILITKNEGHSHATPIIPGNMGVIRRELGIAHHDALYHTNILFVEGHAEFAAFPRMLSTLGYTYEPKTAIFNLGGVGGIRHLGLLLDYFRADGRKAFVILDRHRAAQSTVASLQSRGLLAGEDLFVLPGDFEDAFASTTVADAVAKMAQSVGHVSVLTAADIDIQREKGESTANILKKAWRKTTAHDFSKVDLASHLAGLPPDKIPRDIKAALGAAMSRFDQGAGGPASGNPPEGGG